jgi:hypothetical protein
MKGIVAAKRKGRVTVRNSGLWEPLRSAAAIATT